MSFELQVIRASEFLRLDAHKHLDLEASKEALRTLVKACRKRAIDSALMDLRTLPVLAKPHFTTTELAALVITFREAGFTRQQRLAILYRHDVHGGIRNFAFIGRMRGLQVQAFNEFEAALQWLSEVPVRPVAHPKPGVPIPITTKTSGVRKPQASLIAESPSGSTARPVRKTTNR